MRALTLAGGILVTVVAIGCSDRTQQQAKEAGQEAAQAARATGEAVESAAQDAVNNAERAGDKVQQAAQRTEAINDTADAAAAAVQTATVKSALIADSKVDASGIDVDTDGATKTIVLKGHVPTTAQKTAAGRIAADKASKGYTVRNELVIK